MYSMFKNVLMVTLVMLSASSAIHSVERRTTTKKITKAYIKTKKAKKSHKASNKVSRKKTKEPQKPVLGSLDCASCNAKNLFSDPIRVTYFLCNFCQKGNAAQDGRVTVCPIMYGEDDDLGYDNSLCG